MDTRAFAQVIDRQKPVIYGLVEPRRHSCVTQGIDELEEARGTRLGRGERGGTAVGISS